MIKYHHRWLSQKLSSALNKPIQMKMNSYPIVPFLFSLFLLLAIAFALEEPNGPSQFASGKLFLFGGAMSDSTSKAYNALRDATGKLNPKIVVAISGASSLSLGLEAYYDDLPGSLSYESLFKGYGFQPAVLQLAVDNYATGSSNDSILGKANILLVEQADVIFFNGGDQSRHARAWLKDDGSDSDIMRALRRRHLDGAVLGGTSAGSAIMSNPTYGEGYSYGYFFFNSDLKRCSVGEGLRDDRDGTNSFRYDENGGHMMGFEFIKDVLVDTHFDARGRFGRLAVACRGLSKPYGIGVGEDTVLAINRDVATVYGNDAVWFIDGSTATYNSSGGAYFSVKDLKISYLTEGDVLNLATKEVTSTKQLVTSGSGRAYDSDDIFGQDEGARSIKSLIDSDSLDSIGYSWESRPTARIVFYKGKGERAYRGTGGKYTVDKMLVDIGAL